MIARKRFAAVFCSLAALSIVQGVRFFFFFDNCLFCFWLTILLAIIPQYCNFAFRIFWVGEDRRIFLSTPPPPPPLQYPLHHGPRPPLSVWVRLTHLDSKCQLIIYKVFLYFCRCVVSQWGNLCPLPDLWWTHVLPVCWWLWGDALWKWFEFGATFNILLMSLSFVTIFSHCFSKKGTVLWGSGTVLQRHHVSNREWANVPRVGRCDQGAISGIRHQCREAQLLQVGCPGNTGNRVPVLGSKSGSSGSLLANMWPEQLRELF